MFGAKMYGMLSPYLVATTSSGVRMLEAPYSGVSNTAHSDVTIQTPLVKSLHDNVMFTGSGRLYSSPIYGFNNQWTVSTQIGTGYPLYYPVKLGDFWYVVADTGATGFKLYRTSDHVNWTAMHDLPSKGFGMVDFGSYAVWIGKNDTAVDSFTRVYIDENGITASNITIAGVVAGETFYPMTSQHFGPDNTPDMWLKSNNQNSLYQTYDKGLTWVRTADSYFRRSPIYSGTGHGHIYKLWVPTNSNSDTFYYYIATAPEPNRWNAAYLPWTGIDHIFDIYDGRTVHTYIRFVNSGVVTWRHTTKDIVSQTVTASDFTTISMESLIPNATSIETLYP